MEDRYQAPDKEGLTFRFDEQDEQKATIVLGF